MVAYSPRPYESLYMPYVVVDSVAQTHDGKIKLYGFSGGEPYEAEILPETRLVERLLTSDRYVYDESTKLKATNILDFCATKPDGTAGLRSYDMAISTNAAPLANYPIGINTPYADENSLKKGDVILVGKDRGNEVCYVEIAMRADDCVMLLPANSSSFSNRMIYAHVLKKGVITGFYGENEVLVRSVGEYSASAYRRTTPYMNNFDPSNMFEDNTDYRLTYLYDDVNMPHNFTRSNVWIYDYERNKIETANHTVLDEGDVILVRGAALSPIDCIILKNYPAEADYDYWK